jgi:proteasome accessory factor B
MNLVIALLVTRQFLTKERIRAVVEGYHSQSDEAFERMFERDKEDLREIGIEIEVGNFDELFDDEPGYRIRRDAFELPEIHLDADEAAVVGLAARVWQHARLAEQTSSALVKLRAAGIEVEPDALSLVEPRLSAGEAAFEPFWSAVLTRTPVRFGYSRSGEAPQERHLEPWGLLSWHGRWYVVGYDRDRDATRMFRVSRVRGQVRSDGAAGDYAVPVDLDLRAEAQALMPGAPEGSATLLVRSGAGHALRRRATSVLPADGGFDLVELPYAGRWQTAEEIAGYAADVVVQEPPELRETVVRVLTGAAGLDRHRWGAA